MRVIVPQIVSPFVVSAGQDAAAYSHALMSGSVDPWETASEDLRDEVDIAVGECRSHTEYARFASLPENTDAWSLPGSTVATPTQGLRLLIGGYNDQRSLSDADTYVRSSPMGPLALAVGRAMVRNSLRGEDGPAPILEIGAGHRFVPWALKRMLGRAISIHECSPRYSKVKGAVDVELPRAFAHKAVLPRDRFELAYSVFGNFYSNNQIEVLQRVVDCMRVGGEIFLMWKLLGNMRKPWLIRKWPSIFRHGGLDISARAVSFGDDMPLMRENIITVWARKRSGEVHVRSLFDLAKRMNDKYLRASKEGRARMDEGRDAVIRLSTEGQYFESGAIEPFLPSIAEEMVRTVCKHMEMGPVEVKHKAMDRKLRKEGDAEESVSALTRRVLGDDESMALLESNMPLSILIMKMLHRVLAIRNMNTTLRAHEESMSFYVSKGLLHR